ncbi:MAG: class I SAM-dependent methyltransferase [Gammaproteobacteria bacterium]|nr:class I SAM-dependent methyltransferase [Gammaproteobacteria bacterium]NIR85948.1 class I SAM-dependent methyltransferase [Gammaproteobacteria bacterium]NIR91940.1 class I SAM-dependent methyltransferase [Gammaproteobacteria bacterium]NIU07197.1 class I SAM-dependent methyltransferase [Gammaproteobacteria bacterium]NIV54010.1 methyltransferase domain-containing protein [Gammaproteobacteria bacterium]
MDREGWDRRYAEKAFVWSVGPNQFVAAETEGLRPGRALDLAAGEGRNAVWLAEHGWRVTAVDFSEVGLEKAKRLAAERHADVEWVLADLLDYRPELGGYDLVLMCYLQVPEGARRAILARAGAAVAPGGVFLYIGHDRSNLEHGVGGPQDPAVLCTPEEVAADLAGFGIEKAEVVQRRVEREPGHGGATEAIALDALVRAVRRPRARHTA